MNHNPLPPLPPQLAGLDLQREIASGPRQTDRVVRRLPVEDLRAVLDLTAAGLEAEGFRASATALVTMLAMELPADRVSLGIVHGHSIRLLALSHTTEINHKTQVTQAIVEAMEEALDQQQMIQCPSPPTAPPSITRAHRDLAHRFGASTVCSIPLRAGHRIIGILTVERALDQPLSVQELALCEAAASFAGPLLDLKRKDDQSIIIRCKDRLAARLGQVVGPGHLAAKAATLGCVAVIGFLALATGDFRVTSKALLEGEIQQAAVAPFDGYLDTATVRAGDRVRAGHVLARLQDRDIRLERLKWLSQQEQLRKEHRQALADRDAAKVEVLSAQLRQADAELALAVEKLSRVEIRAPFDAVVVSGDLSQRLGSPLKKGDTLFELAPLDSYRIVLEADEHDISYLAVGQRGRLVLTSLPHDAFDMTITSITPVATARDGRNYFRVEGRFDGVPPSHLRPAMEGVAKVSVDQRRLAWIWLHDAVDWATLTLWAWLP